jgi:uncharacterized iron-regulated membrane protein
MLKLPQRDTKALLAIHGWSGILLGLLLYAVICTGVAAVYAVEINDWESPLSNTASETVFPAGTDEVVRRLAKDVDPQFHEGLSVYRGAGGRMYMFFHKHETDPEGKPSERGVQFELDPKTWQTLSRHEGWYEEIEEKTKAGGVAHFLVNLHVRLHIPEPFGLFVTGVLGLAMMIAAVTGILVHRHLLAELFTMRLAKDALLRRRDLHVVAGTWNLPFALILAFTGSFFSFASSVGIPAIAMVEFGGDQEALIDTLYGSARPENTNPATLSNLDAMIADTRARNQAEPNFVSIEHYGRADAAVSVSTGLPGNTLVYNSFLYDGVSGALLRENPPLGKIPSMGASLVGLMYPLHFGNFAGAASKAVWVALGAAAAYVSLTGMLLWVRRREEQPAWRRMSRFVHYFGYGLPLTLVAAPYAFFVLRDSSMSAIAIQDIAFLAVAGICAVVALRIDDLDRLRRVLLRATGVGLFGLPVIRLATGGMGWAEATQLGISAVPGIDIALVVFGAMCFWAARSRVQVAMAPKEGGRRSTRALESGAPTA